MPINLKKAQKHLTEERLRGFWSFLTGQYENICTHSGVSINWQQPMTQQIVYKMAEDLLKCDTVVMACPVYMYHYEAEADPPHHVAALTLIKCKSKGIFLSYFNAKGQKSPRLQQEKKWLDMLAQQIQQRWGLLVKVHMYLGRNLQEKDYIGLCQLYSLFYLCQFVEKIHTKITHYEICHRLPEVVNPNLLVASIRKYDENTLHQFYLRYFTSCQGLWCEK